MIWSITVFDALVGSAFLLQWTGKQLPTRPPLTEWHTIFVGAVCIPCFVVGIYHDMELFWAMLLKNIISVPLHGGISKIPVNIWTIQHVNETLLNKKSMITEHKFIWCSGRTCLPVQESRCQFGTLYLVVHKIWKIRLYSVFGCRYRSWSGTDLNEKLFFSYGIMAGRRGRCSSSIRGSRVNDAVKTRAWFWRNYSSCSRGCWMSKTRANQSLFPLWHETRKFAIFSKNLFRATWLSLNVMARIVLNEGHKIIFRIWRMRLNLFNPRIWLMFDPKWAAVNDLNSVWSSTSLCGTPNHVTRSYDVTMIIYAHYYHWRFCQLILLFQAWRKNGQGQSGNSAHV